MEVIMIFHNIAAVFHNIIAVVSVELVTIIFHGITAILGLYLFILFAWWWWDQKDATTIYKYTCFLMLGISIAHSGACWLYIVRWHLSHEITIYPIRTFVPCWWPLRQLFMLFPLTMYSIYATKKIYYEHQAKKQMVYDFERRKTPRTEANINGIVKEQK